jgi:hypothetical protein
MQHHGKIYLFERGVYLRFEFRKVVRRFIGCHSSLLALRSSGGTALGRRSSAPLKQFAVESSQSHGS